MEILTYDIQRKGLLTESVEKNESVIKKTLTSMGDIVDGTFSFGTGIGAFLTPVTDLLNGEYPHMTQENMVMLYITAIWIITNKHRDKVKILLEKIRERKLTDVLPKVVDFLKSTEDIALKIADEVGYTVSSIVEIGAFTFFAFPILDALRQLINSGEITLENGAGYLKSMLLAVGVLTIKNIFNNIIKRLRFRKKQFENDDELINEEVASPKIKNVYNDTGISIDVPLTLDALCQTEENWCKEWLKPRFESGTPYIVNVKDTDSPGIGDKKFLIHHQGKVFLHREPDPAKTELALTGWDDEGDFMSHKKLISQIPKLIEFFKLDYNLKEKMQYDMPIDQEQISDWSKTNNFSNMVGEVMNGSKSPDELYNFMGDDVEEYPSDYWRRTQEENWVELDVYGVTLYIDYDEFKSEVMEVGDDDWYIDYATGSYYDSPYEEMDDEELNYVTCHLDKENLEKTDKLLVLMGLESKNADCDNWEEGEMADLFDTHFGNTFDRVGGELLYDLGYGLGRERVKVIKKYMEEDTLFQFEVNGDTVEIKLSYSQLLYIIHVHGLNNFSELVVAPFNVIEDNLGDMWHDTYDYDEESIDDFNNTYKGFIDDVLEKSENLGMLIQNRKSLIGTLRKLGFKIRKYGNELKDIPDDIILNRDNIELIDEENKRKIWINEFDNNTGKISFTIESGDARESERYTTDLSELSDYVTSDTLF